MTTTTVYADAADGHVRSYSTTSYATARSGGGSLDLDPYGASDLTIGQLLDTSDGDFWSVMESFVGFDTSSIDDSDTISAAVLNMTAATLQIDSTNFTIQARLRDWGATLTTADYVAGASLSGLTLLATKTTASGWSSTSAYDFTDVAMPANVSKTGTTRMLLCSDRVTSGTTPGDYEILSAVSADTTGTTSDPKLTVTHAAGESGATGTGAGTGAASTASGSGAETFTGTGAGTGTAATASGDGAETFTGTGAGTGAASTGDGAGTETITGTGAGTQAAATGTGDGLQIQDVTGTGAGTQAAASGSGLGTGGMVIPTSSGGGRRRATYQPPVLPARPPRPARPFIVGSGAAIQAAASAAGWGTVNDDELVIPLVA